MLPWIFGKDFGEAILILRGLCWTLIFGAAHNVAFDALNAADRHHARFVSGTAAGLLGLRLWHHRNICCHLSAMLELCATLRFLSERQRSKSHERQ
jgi:hypothetical protein